jgi:hypothetical protein
LAENNRGLNRGRQTPKKWMKNKRGLNKELQTTKKGMDEEQNREKQRIKINKKMLGGKRATDNKKKSGEIKIRNKELG